MIEVGGFILGILAWSAWMGFLVRATGTRARSLQVNADPTSLRRLEAVLEGVPAGLSLAAFDVKEGWFTGTRLVVEGLCPQLDLAFDRPGAARYPDTLDFGLGRYVSHGQRLASAAVLQRAARAPLLALAATEGVVPERVRVLSGKVEVDVPEEAARRAGVLEGVARAALSVAGVLRPPSDIPARLAENVADHPETGIRLFSLQALLNEYPGHAATAAAQHTAAATDAPALRLLAGRSLGEEGRPVLIEMLRDTRLDDSTAGEAVDVLRTLPADLAGLLLTQALEPRGKGIAASLTARAVIDALRRAGLADAALLAGAVRAADGAVAVEAVRLLADLGAADAVLLLKEAAADHPSPEVRRRAEQAVMEVQSRLQGAAPGQLSLSGGQSGALTLADDPPSGQG